MIKELKYFFYVIIIFFFIFFISRYYFSDEYKKKSYRSLNLIEDKINIFSENLVILESNTDDMIEYIEYQKDKNKKKYYYYIKNIFQFFNHYIFSGVLTPNIFIPNLITIETTFKKAILSSEILLSLSINLLFISSFPLFQ